MHNECMGLYGNLADYCDRACNLYKKKLHLLQEILRKQ